MNPRKTIQWGKRLFMALPFLLMQVFIYYMGNQIHYFEPAMVAPNLLFTMLWILLFLGICRYGGKVLGRVLYGVIFLLYFLLFLAHSVYFPLTKSFFGFHLLQMAGEGSSYVLDTMVHTSPWIYLYVLLVLASGIWGWKNLDVAEHRSWKKAVLFALGFLILHMGIPLLYGHANKELKWNSFQNARNVYDSFYDKNKAMKACGLYEYTVRDFYITFLKPEEKEDPTELATLTKDYSTHTEHKKNSYTGQYKGKNVIFLQMEGIDNWLVDRETMPNLYALMNQSINFTQHYSYYNGGGSTFNSELAVNTGFITPVSYTRNAYTFVTNSFPYSLPNVLKKENYQVNAFHMNSGEFYSRKANYLNWGYDHYHGLMDEEDYKDASYELDRELIQNPDFYEMIFQGEQPFMDYIITYTPHKPFNSSNEAVQLLLKETYGDQVPDLTEEEYARLMAGETDKMIGLLIQGLKDNDLYDNTVIVGYADHYLYTLSDKTILDKYKTTENNLINQTPFFLWSSDQKGKEITKVNGQIDILPTMLNLLGITYEEEDYIGNDILSMEYPGYVFFSDGSMYDGTNYTENGDLPQIEKNDLTLKYDYFRQKQKE